MYLQAIGRWSFARQNTSDDGENADNAFAGMATVAIYVPAVGKRRCVRQNTRSDDGIAGGGAMAE